jgi:hypothetical protein
MLAFFVLSVFEAVNGFPTLLAMFSTAQPWRLQLLIFVAIGGIGLVLPAGLLGLVAGAAPRWLAQASTLGRRATFVLGPSLGGLAAGAMSLGAAVHTGEGPPAPSFESADAFAPILGVALGPVAGVIAQTTVLLVIVAAMDRLTRSWTARRLLGAILLFVLGVLVGAGPATSGLLRWAVSGVPAGALLVVAYAWFLRADVSLIPLAVGTMRALAAARGSAFGAFPGAAVGGALGVALTVLVTWWWWSELRRAQHPT